MQAPPFALAVLLSSVAVAQETVPQPAESAKERGRPRAAEEEAGHPRSWEAPGVEARVPSAAPPLKEEERIGAYAQPRWTARRRFPTTRVYVVPEGTLSFEWWLEAKLEAGAKPRFRSQYEFEFGLGRRLQLDLYLTTQQEGLDAPLLLHREKVELRYALADWGDIPTNPTVYLELVRENGGPPRAEVKLLLGDEAATRWHWGVNAVFEAQLGGAQENEYAFTAAVAYTVLDEIFSLGLEAQLEAADDASGRLRFNSVEAAAGPSLQWRPVPPLHVDLVGLFGAAAITGAAPHAIFESLVVIGWEI